MVQILDTFTVCKSSLVAGGEDVHALNSLTHYLPRIEPQSCFPFIVVVNVCYKVYS